MCTRNVLLFDYYILIKLNSIKINDISSLNGNGLQISFRITPKIILLFLIIKNVQKFLVLGDLFSIIFI